MTRPMPYSMRRISVRDECAPKFGRQVLTLWSGPFASNFEGTATELPKHGGYMVTLAYSKVRVSCESPRTDENYARTDAAIQAAFTQAETDGHR